ncbi:Mycobacterium numidiamassiliense ORFan [Mycobacterium numidiamassiliense]|uniref:Mycobacterium numidiamassiliense ORFan n=1 Tax=Mycobacterium numidiamassiliense TaxID=1841861 RepID=A0A2U3P9W0_9MYCO|nr:Mycobacterium numidiamassiliense ORFan [Mycobacterium numidiamassiliense]
MLTVVDGEAGGTPGTHTYQFGRAHTAHYALI